MWSQVTESVTSMGRQVIIPTRTFSAVIDKPYSVNPQGKTFRFWQEAALRYKKDNEKLVGVDIGREGVQLSFIKSQGDSDAREEKI